MSARIEASKKVQRARRCSVRTCVPCKSVHAYVRAPCKCVRACKAGKTVGTTYRGCVHVGHAAEDASIGNVGLAVVGLVGQGVAVAARAVTETVAGRVDGQNLCGA